MKYYINQQEIEQVLDSLHDIYVNENDLELSFDEQEIRRILSGECNGVKRA